MVHVLEACMD